GGRPRRRSPLDKDERQAESSGEEESSRSKIHWRQHINDHQKAGRKKGGKTQATESNRRRGMSRRPHTSEQPTREMVLDYLEKNPGLGAKRDIARGLDVPTEHKAELRRILNELEAEGALVRTAKRAFQPAEMPPPTGIVKFERIDRDGELVGRAVGRDGPFGPDILYHGSAGH